MIAQHPVKSVKWPNLNECLGVCMTELIRNVIVAVLAASLFLESYRFDIVDDKNRSGRVVSAKFKP